MIYKEIKIGAALLRTYVLDNYDSIDLKRRRAMILICPGGGYRHVSNREAEAVAIRFNSLGYNAAVLFYTVAPFDSYETPADWPGVWPKPQQELSEAIIYIRDNAEALNTDPDKLALLGFSAGGHLAASLGVFWKEFGGERCRPNALVLCYPVITSGEKAHRGSIDDLIGYHKELLDKVSLEKQVTTDVPPTYIWTTKTDQAVPFENSTMFKEALDRCKIVSDIHIYPYGSHGLSLGTKEVAKAGTFVETCVRDWPERVDEFLLKVFKRRF